MQSALAEWTSSNTLVVVGWVVGPLLGFIFAIVRGKMREKRKRVSWALAEHQDLLTTDMLSRISEQYGTPVTVNVGSERPDSLHSVTLRFANTGNEVIDSLHLVVKPHGANILGHELANDLGEYRKKIEFSLSNGQMIIDCEYINPGTLVELTLLMSNYVKNSLEVDLAMPGVSIHQVRASILPEEIAQTKNGPWSFGAAIPFLNLRYDPTAVETRKLAEEVGELKRDIRQSIYSLTSAIRSHDRRSRTASIFGSPKKSCGIYNDSHPIKIELVSANQDKDDGSGKLRANVDAATRDALDDQEKAGN